MHPAFSGVNQEKIPVRPLLRERTLTAQKCGGRTLGATEGDGWTE